MREIQANTPSMSEERGVTYEYFLEYSKIDTNDFMENVNWLKEQGLISETTNNRLTLSPQGKELLDEQNAIPLAELSDRVWQKVYELYKRENENVAIQFNSVQLARILGISNFQKMLMAIDELYESDLIGKPAKTRYSANFLLSRKGIMYKENGRRNEHGFTDSKHQPIIVHDVKGNVAINSVNTIQTINGNDILQYCWELKRLINETLSDKEKEDALTATATIEELSKAKNPNKGLIQAFLNNLDKIPILIEIVEKIRAALGFF
jgi:hypothetical protein